MRDCCQCVDIKSTRCAECQKQSIRYWEKKRKRKNKCPRNKIQISKKLEYYDEKHALLSVNRQNGKRKNSKKKNPNVIYTSVFVIHLIQSGTDEQHPDKP